MLVAATPCHDDAVRLTLPLTAVLATALLSACTGGSTPESAEPVAATTSASASPSASPGGVDPMAAMAEPSISSPVEAGLRLESLLGQHSILASDMMRARIRSDADLAQSANAALGQNTEAMGALLEPVIGAKGSAQFGKAWATHIQELSNYARGLGTEDDALLEKTRKNLLDYEGELADLFVSASRGRLDRSAALGAVRMHIDHLLEGADAYAAEDYDKAAELYRTSYSHTFDIGVTLAHALLPAKVGKQLDTPQLQLRSALTKLLGEHVALVIASMRSSVGAEEDFTAMGDALNANTTALATAIDGLFGAAAGRGFQSRWADHVDNLMAYTRATVGDDPAGQERARLELREFESSFASFLDSATQKRLGEPLLTQMYVMHDRELMAEIDAYHAGNFEQAQELSGQTYTAMFTIAGQLSEAIGATLAGKLPRGGSQTGAGGTAHHVKGH